MRPALRTIITSLAPVIVMLDFNIAAVALPSVRDDLGFSPATAQWVITAAALPFGCFLIAGGRLADLLGRRRVLIAALGLLSLASLGAGVATTQAGLLVARAALGIGAAIAVPAALSLVTAHVDEGPMRDRALGVYGALISFALVFGTVVGGFLTDVLGWRSGFFVDAGLALIAVVAVLRATRAVPAVRQPMAGEVPRAVATTIALAALLWALSAATSAAALSPEAGALLMVALLAGWAAYRADRRAPQPLFSRQLLRRGTVAGATVAAVLTVAAGTGVFVLLATFLQDLFRYTAGTGGLALAVLGAAGVASARTCPLASRRFGVVPVLVVAMLLQAAGILLMISTQLGDGLAALLAGCAIMGAGHFAACVMFTTLAIRGVASASHGLATAIIVSAQEIGAAVGLAVLTAVSSAGTDDSPTSALSGFHHALATAAGISAVGALVVAAIFSTKSFLTP
ncbi:MFS transporter [Actinophytocola sp.]|uniref:MFS transporter n=1 Tax=Actinophytocola sp. TaxID=1872138 RepID=UPI002ED68101